MSDPIIIGETWTQSVEKINDLKAAVAASQEASADFNTLYLGSKATFPTTDNAGAALRVSAMFFNTSDQVIYIWNGSAWVSAPSGPPGADGDNAIYNSYANFLAATVPAGTDAVQVLHANRLLSFIRVPWGNITLADASVWAPGDAMVSPEHWGAFGFGSTDDSAAWTAMDAFLLSRNGGRVLATGVYSIPAGFTLTASGVTIDGRGTGIIRSDGLPGEHCITATGLTRIAIKDFRFEIPRGVLRSETRGGPANAFCMFFIDCNNIRVHNCNTDGGVVGFWTVNCDDVLVEGCNIAWPKADGIHFGHGSKRCKAIGNTITNFADDALSTTFYAGFERPSEITFADNICIGNGLWGNGAAVYSADHVTVSGNTFVNTGLSGVTVTQFDGGAICSDVVVSGNNIISPNRADKEPEDYWFGIDPALNTPISGHMQIAALAIEGNSVLVTGNKISDVGGPGLTRNAIVIGEGTRINVSGNYVDDASGDGIVVGPSGTLSQITIANNNLDNVDGVMVRINRAVSNSLTIVGNMQGVGAINPAEPYSVMLSNTGTVNAIVTQNISTSGRGTFSDGNNPSLTLSGNIPA